LKQGVEPTRPIGPKIAGMRGWELAPFRTRRAMTDKAEATRLFLVTPPSVDLDAFPARLAEALAAGEVAAVLIASAGPGAEETARKLLPVVQEAGAAALVLDDTRIAGRLQADGVHIATGLGDLRHALDALRGSRTVGAGNIHSRHTAMQAGELGVDYVFFGRPHGDTHDAAHGKVLDLAQWCSELMEIPAVVMAGRSLDSVVQAAATGADFVALHDAVWAHPAGPGDAVARAAAALREPGRRAA
jgi:thiamine-phosphate pyrophosphorylase